MSLECRILADLTECMEPQNRAPIGEASSKPSVYTIKDIYNMNTVHVITSLTLIWQGDQTFWSHLNYIL
jgi:hypothetical protein